MNTIVIGAGLAGLAAAWRLQSAGHEVSLLEQSDTVGGRIRSVSRDAFTLDGTLETIDSGQRHLLGWIRELGLADTLLPIRPLQITQVADGRSEPIDPQSLTGVASIPGVGLRDSVKLLRWSRLMSRYAPLLDPTAPERAASLDFRSVSDFARLYFGESVHARWVGPEVSDVFGADPAELSRVAALLIWCARSTGRDASAIHGVVRGSLARVAEAAADQLPIRRKVAATRIDERPGGGFAVECEGVEGGRGVLEGQAVVVATSAAEAGRLIGPIATSAERDFLDQVEMMPEIVYAAALTAPPSGLPQRVRVPLAEDQPIDSLLLEPGQANGRAPEGSGLVILRATERFTAAHGGTTDEVVEKGLRAGLSRLFPSVDASVEHGVLSRRPDARPRFGVGAYRALDRFRRVQADRRELGRRLYFAGDYLIAPTAEGSVVAGLRAAQDSLADLSR